VCVLSVTRITGHGSSNDQTEKVIIIESRRFCSLRSIVSLTTTNRTRNKYRPQKRLTIINVPELRLELRGWSSYVSPASTTSRSRWWVSYGAGSLSVRGSTPQISRAYSAIVLSLENLPEAAMFMSDIFNHLSVFYSVLYLHIIFIHQYIW